MRISICFIGILFVAASEIRAQDAPVSNNPLNSVSQYQTIEVAGGTVFYDFEKEIFQVTKDSQTDPTVFIGSQTITAQQIQYEQSSNILHATGIVRLWDQGNILRGDRLVYDVGKQEGELRGLKSSELLENIYFGGERLSIGHRAAKETQDATGPAQIPEYTLYDGTLTSNDLPVPFYKIKYDRLVFSPNERASANNMFFMARNWPLFYAPYFTKSLSEHEVTYFVNVDHYSHLGWAWMNRVMWRPNDEWVLNLYGDYYTDAGIGKGAKVKFDIPGQYGPKGMVYANHIKQEAPDNDSIFDGDDRYDISMEYAEDLPYGMRLSAQGHQFSDSEYRWDYRGPEDAHDIDLADLERDSVSHVSLSKWWDDQSLRATYAHRFDSFYYSGLPYVEREPQVHFEQYPTPLFDSNVYADLQVDYGRYHREQGYTYPINKYTLFDRTSYYDDVDRMDANVRFGYPFFLPNRFTLQPWVGFRGTYYADPMRAVGDPIQPYEFDDESRLMLQGGLDLSTRTVYEFQPFLDRYARMRAVVEPILQYAYYHPNHDLEEIASGPDVRFPYIDPTDDFRFQMHRISALVRTRMQGKTPEGGTSDFMTLSTGFQFDYLPDDNLLYDNFEYFDDRANHGDYRFSDLVEDFGIYPYEWLTFGNSLRYDIDDSKLRSTYTYAQIQPIKPVHFTVGYLSFIDPALDREEQQDVTFNVNWKLSNKYQIYYTTWYDIDDNSFRQNHIGIVRDMYDFYGLFQFGYQRHPTLGNDFRFSVGLQFWGIGKKKNYEAPVLFF